MPDVSFPSPRLGYLRQLPARFSPNETRVVGNCGIGKRNFSIVCLS